MVFFLFSALALALPASRTAVVQLGAYPGYVPPGQTTSLVGGTLAIEQVAGSAMITVKGYLTGLELSSTSGWHIHEGFTCSDSTLVRGHYFPGMATDPWNAVSWQSDFRGVAPISFSIAQFTLDGINPVMGRTVVVHDMAANARVACGVIQPLSGELVEFSRYPEYCASFSQRHCHLTCHLCAHLYVTAPCACTLLRGRRSGLLSNPRPPRREHRRQRRTPHRRHPDRPRRWHGRVARPLRLLM